MSGTLTITQIGSIGLELVAGDTSTLALTALAAIDLEVAGGAPGPMGPAGENSVKINQLVAATAWTINHNLGRNPQVTVLSVGGVEVEAGVTHTSLNQLIISFTIASAGSALLI